jgi:hypothetical protein
MNANLARSAILQQNFSPFFANPKKSASQS